MTSAGGTFGHIDADGAGTSSHDPAFNVWCPLVAVGRDQPSLELVRESHKLMRSLPLLPATTATRTDEWVAEHFPMHARWAPELEPRDLLVFSDYTLHRTQVLDLPAVRRLSCEWRVTQHPAYLPA